MTKHRRSLDTTKPETVCVQDVASSSGGDYTEELSDISSDESFEISNPFDALESDDSEVDAVGSKSRQKLKFYQQDSVTEDGEELDDPTMATVCNNNEVKSENSVAKETGFAIDTVKKFSGLDKAAVIGINPYVNEEHADFKKFILNLATRAKDNLIIITTSDKIKQKLDTMAK